MLRSFKSMLGYSLAASDGDIGKVDDVYFEDGSWTVRYLVADTRRWLPGRLVLISTAALGKPDTGGRSVPVMHTKQQVKESPGIDSDMPVSRRYEAALAQHYSWPAYWADELPTGREPSQSTPPWSGFGDEHAAEPASAPSTAEAADHGARLRSALEVIGYDIQAADGEIGHVHDLVIDTESWIIRYVIIGTGTWWPGEKLVIAPDWIDEVRWDESSLRIDLEREVIKSCPRYDASEPINRRYEQRLYDFYGRPVYW